MLYFNLHTSATIPSLFLQLLRRCKRFRVFQPFSLQFLVNIRCAYYSYKKISDFVDGPLSINQRVTPVAVLVLSPTPASEAPPTGVKQPPSYSEVQQTRGDWPQPSTWKSPQVPVRSPTTPAKSGPVWKSAARPVTTRGDVSPQAAHSPAGQQAGDPRSATQPTASRPQFWETSEAQPPEVRPGQKVHFI